MGLEILKVQEKADIYDGHYEDVLTSFLVCSGLQRLELFDHLVLREVNIDFDFLEFEHVLEQRSVKLSSILGSLVFKTFDVGVHKDLSNGFGGNVVLENQPERLNRIGCGHFKVGITAFEVVEAL